MGVWPKTCGHGEEAGARTLNILTNQGWDGMGQNPASGPVRHGTGKNEGRGGGGGTLATPLLPLRNPQRKRRVRAEAKVRERPKRGSVTSVPRVPGPRGEGGGPPGGVTPDYVVVRWGGEGGGRQMAQNTTKIFRAALMD